MPRSLICFLPVLGVAGAVAQSEQATEPTPPLAPTNFTAQVQLKLEPEPSRVWERGIGEGFARTAREFSLSAGAGYGVMMLGSRAHHDMTFFSASYAGMLGPTVGTNTWCRGNWQWRVEGFWSWQFYPQSEWTGGITPHLRYNWATGTRWIPYVDGGLGFCLTTIRQPDLGGAFQFAPQAAVGLNWFLSERTAISAECRLIHLSSAHLEVPNNGVNALNGILSLIWFF